MRETYATETSRPAICRWVSPLRVRAVRNRWPRTARSIVASIDAGVVVLTSGSVLGGRPRASRASSAQQHQKSAMDGASVWSDAPEPWDDASECEDAALADVADPKAAANPKERTRTHRRMHDLHRHRPQPCDHVGVNSRDTPTVNDQEGPSAA